MTRVLVRAMVAGVIGAVTVLVGQALTGSAASQRAPAPAAAAASQASATQKWLLNAYRFSAEMLPEPSTSAPNPPKLVPKPADASLTLPPGFKIEPYAEGMKGPRWIVEAPNGDLFVSDSNAGIVYVLHDANANRVIEEGERTEFVTGLNKPFGMAFWRDYFYVANTDAVLRYAYKAGQTKSDGAAERIADLPHGETGHWTRNIKFTPDGSAFYVTVGSASNVDPDPDPLRGAVLRFRPDGSDREVVANGLRNPIGFDFHPQTREPWVAVQERDGLGDDLVPDYVTRLKKGAFYGWPYAYAGTHEDPRRKNERPDLVKLSVIPDVLVQAHSAIMGLAFYGARVFPVKYHGGAFAALRGSSSRSKRTGYKVVFLPFENGKPTGSYQDFIVGWMAGEDKPEVWGRPVGVTITKDGSLLIADDGAGKIWRVSFSG
jgi:glucose/arabinose dehydrogenase